MEILIVLANSVVLSLLYQKQLEQSADIAVVKSKVEGLEKAIIERRKPIQNDCYIRHPDLYLDDEAT